MAMKPKPTPIENGCYQYRGYLIMPGQGCFQGRWQIAADPPGNKFVPLPDLTVSFNSVEEACREIDLRTLELQ
jgi:hypothetical protein